MTPKKSRLRGWDLSGEIRTEILISIPASDVQNGWMATHLVTNRCDLGSLGVPGPAGTPRLDPAWIWATDKQHRSQLDMDLDISDLGFDRISSHKMGGSPRAPSGSQGP